MNKLTIYPSASKDIENIFNYISLDLANPIAANSFIDDLSDTFKKIVMFPKMYPIIDNPFVKDKLVRKTLVKSYIVFYKVAVNEIQVLRVLYSRSNYQTLLK